MKRKMKDSISQGRREGEGIFSLVLAQPGPLPLYSFFSRLGGKEKHKQGNTGDKGMFLSAGALRWIRPGFGKVKWDLAIKSLRPSIKGPYLES